MKKLLFTLGLLGSLTTLLAQRYDFSTHVSANLIQNNPALTGNTSGYRANAFYHYNRLGNLGHNHVIGYSAEAFLPRIYGAVGLIGSHDLMPGGTLSNHMIGISYAHYFRLTEGGLTISLGLSGQYNLIQQNVETNFRSDIHTGSGAVGFSIYHRRWLASYGVKMIPYEQDQFRFRHSIFGSYTFPVSRRWSLHPAVNLIIENNRFSPHVQLVAQYRFLKFGAGYMIHDRLTGLVGVGWSRFTIAYSYGFWFGSKSINATEAGHEINLTVEIKNKNKKYIPHYFRNGF